MSGRVRGTKRSDQNILAPDPKKARTGGRGGRGGRGGGGGTPIGYDKNITFPNVQTFTTTVGYTGFVSQVDPGISLLHALIWDSFSKRAPSIPSMSADKRAKYLILQIISDVCKNRVFNNYKIIYDVIKGYDSSKLSQLITFKQIAGFLTILFYSVESLSPKGQINLTYNLSVDQWYDEIILWWMDSCHDEKAARKITTVADLMKLPSFLQFASFFDIKTLRQSKLVDQLIADESIDIDGTDLRIKKVQYESALKYGPKVKQSNRNGNKPQSQRGLEILDQVNKYLNLFFGSGTSQMEVLQTSSLSAKSRNIFKTASGNGGNFGSPVYGVVDMTLQEDQPVAIGIPIADTAPSLADIGRYMKHAVSPHLDSALSILFKTNLNLLNNDVSAFNQSEFNALLEYVRQYKPKRFFNDSYTITVNIQGRNPFVINIEAELPATIMARDEFFDGVTCKVTNLFNDESVLDLTSVAKRDVSWNMVRAGFVTRLQKLFGDLGLDMSLSNKDFPAKMFLITGDFMNFIKIIKHCANSGKVPQVILDLGPTFIIIYPKVATPARFPAPRRGEPQVSGYTYQPSRLLSDKKLLNLAEKIGAGPPRPRENTGAWRASVIQTIKDRLLTNKNLKLKDFNANTQRLISLAAAPQRFRKSGNFQSDEDFLYDIIDEKLLDSGINIGNINSINERRIKIVRLKKLLREQPQYKELFLKSVIDPGIIEAINSLPTNVNTAKSGLGTGDRNLFSVLRNIRAKNNRINTNQDKRTALYRVVNSDARYKNAFNRVKGDEGLRNELISLLRNIKTGDIEKPVKIFLNGLKNKGKPEPMITEETGESF